MFRRTIVLLVAGLIAAWGGSAFAQKELRWGTSAVALPGTARSSRWPMC